MAIIIAVRTAKIVAPNKTGIPKNIAEAIAQTIHETNPRHITQKILKKFKEKLSNIK